MQRLLSEIADLFVALPTGATCAEPPRRLAMFEVTTKVTREVIYNDEEIIDSMNLFYEEVSPHLRTSRDIARSQNRLSVTWPPVAGEVFAGNFVALESIRLKLLFPVALCLAAGLRHRPAEAAATPVWPLLPRRVNWVSGRILSVAAVHATTIRRGRTTALAPSP